jgi:hypothetical protein
MAMVPSVHAAGRDMPRLINTTIRIATPSSIPRRPGMAMLKAAQNMVSDAYWPKPLHGLVSPGHPQYTPGTVTSSRIVLIDI